MARPKKPAAVVELAALDAAIAEIPREAERWTRAAHRQAFDEWKARGNIGEFGLKRRFNIRPWSDLGKGKSIVRASLDYDFSPRRRQIGVRGAKTVGRRKAQQTPAFVSSGAMRDELMRRRPKRVKSAPGEVRTRFSLYHRSLNLMGGQHGIERIDRIKQPVTYMMTVYQDSVARAGAWKKQVTRMATVPRITLSAKTYAQEWDWRPGEVEQIRRRSEQILASTVRSAAFDRSGRLRAKYRKDGAA